MPAALLSRNPPRPASPRNPASSWPSQGWSSSRLPGRPATPGPSSQAAGPSIAPLELGAAPVLEVDREDGGLRLAALGHSNVNTYASPSLRPDTARPLWYIQYVTRVAMRSSATCANRSRARSRKSRETNLGRKSRPTRARHPRHSNSTGGPLRSACTAALLAPTVPHTIRTRASITAGPRIGRPQGILPCRTARRPPSTLSTSRHTSLWSVRAHSKGRGEMAPAEMAAWEAVSHTSEGASAAAVVSLPRSTRGTRDTS
jgi:hypothetical protein